VSTKSNLLKSFDPFYRQYSSEHSTVEEPEHSSAALGEGKPSMLIIAGPHPASSSVDQEDVTVRAPLRAPTLSPREIEVMLTWILNDSKSAVCRQLYISPGTVNTHVARIRDKYQSVGRPAPTKAALLARALQDGHITLEQL
jgi:DNA-binding CsgD family transcriptional regulator